MTPSNLEDQIIKAKDRHGCHIFGVNLKTWAFIHTYSQWRSQEFVFGWAAENL
jgi:hypothetical protein